MTAASTSMTNNEVGNCSTMTVRLNDTSIPTSCHEITIRLVDGPKFKNAQGQGNVLEINEWMMNKNMLLNHQELGVSVESTVEEETESGVFQGYRYEGPANDQYRYAVYEDRKREKMIPQNGDPIQYSEWVVTRTWEEAAGHQTIETRSRQRLHEKKTCDHHTNGWFRAKHTHYVIIRTWWTEQWTVTTDFDGRVTETTPVEVGGRSYSREAGVQDGWWPPHSSMIY